MAPDLLLDHTPTIVDEISGIVTLYNDGSIQRHAPLLPPFPANHHFSNGIATKDVIIDPQTRVWARIFLPKSVAEGQRAPIVLHFHGGSMCMGSPDSTISHNFCSKMAVKSNSIWVSVAYRLSPEHRLPAAYNDCYAALCWLQFQAMDHREGWLSDHADFSRCFLAGESAGGTIVHFVAMRAAESDWERVQLRGLILIHPGFFPTIPQMKPWMDPFLTDKLLETSLRLSLPPGAEITTGILHPLVNPFHQDSRPKLGEVELPPAIVAVAEKDILRDAAVQYYETLKEAGKEVQLWSTKGQSHCFHLLKEDTEEDTEALENQLVRFIQRPS